MRLVWFHGSDGVPLALNANSVIKVAARHGSNHENVHTVIELTGMRQGVMDELADVVREIDAARGRSRRLLELKDHEGHPVFINRDMVVRVQPPRLEGVGMQTLIEFASSRVAVNLPLDEVVRKISEEP